MRQFAIVGVLLTILVCGIALATRAQDDGPMAPPPKFEVNRIPAVPHPGPPPIPVEEIIRRFGANEDQAQKIYKTYDFTQTVRVVEVNNPDGVQGGGGTFSVTGDNFVRPDGARVMRPTKPSESTLKAIRFTLDDVRTVESLPLFFLTSSETADYNFIYVGQDKLDELNTYVFQVKPKQVSRTHRFFDGAIWVDDHDLAIVKTFGKYVTELSDNNTDLPFSMYEIYRENFQQKYWLPTYVTSEAYINPGQDSELHLRLIVRSTTFKSNSFASGAPPAVTTTFPDTQTIPPQPPDTSSIHPHIN